MECSESHSAGSKGIEGRGNYQVILMIRLVQPEGFFAE
jgi:hypothetical protein